MRDNITMIHGSSNDPVYIKKIALKIWTLRDEIQAVVKKQLLEKGEVADITDIIDEYDINSRVQPAVEPLPEVEGEIAKEDELDDSEDAMAAALAAAEAGEEVEESAPEGGEIAEEGNLDDSEDAMAAALAGDGGEEEPKKEEKKGGESLIIQRHPSLEENRVHLAKTVLAEIGMDRMFFFCSQKFTEGQSIVIEFIVPKRFVINAEVVYCRQFSMKSRIISKAKLPYRVAVDFNFLKEGERTLLRQFLKTVEPEVQEPVVMNKKSEDDDDDEFSELDDL